MRGFSLGLAAFALLMAAPAQAACADAPTVAAARLHEFETMLMTVSLRCNRIGVDMRGSFDGLVTTYRAQFAKAADLLQQFLSATDGKRKGAGYDRYSVLLANKYGGGNTSRDHCQLFSGVTAEIVKAKDEGRILTAVANAMVAHPVLEAAGCGLVTAARP